MNRPLAPIKIDIIGNDGHLSYEENFLDYAPSIIIEGVSWRNDSITLFGKTHPQPRLTAWVGDQGIQYTYSKIKMTTAPWTPLLFEIKTKLEKKLSTSFNSVLINYYRNGQDHMSYHSDDEKELGVNPTIASLSFGESRLFQLKHKWNLNIPEVKLTLNHGSLVVMSGELQHFWKHRINKTNKIIGPRLNLTYRLIKTN